jgi:hypothetical protein
MQAAMKAKRCNDGVYGNGDEGRAERRGGE